MALKHQQVHDWTTKVADLAIHNGCDEGSEKEAAHNTAKTGAYVHLSSLFVHLILYIR